MKTVPFEFDGRTYHLLLNGAALFDIYDRFGADTSILDPIEGKSRKSFENTCWYLAALATQGEMFRRWEGYDPQPFPLAEDFLLLLPPTDAVRAKIAIQRAVMAGFGREEGEAPKEIDKGLLELEKKTGDV